MGGRAENMSIHGTVAERFSALSKRFVPDFDHRDVSPSCIASDIPGSTLAGSGNISVSPRIG